MMEREKEELVFVNDTATFVVLQYVATTYWIVQLLPPLFLYSVLAHQLWGAVPTDISTTSYFF